ncbi:transposase [Spirochaetota bacterium]
MEHKKGTHTKYYIKYHYVCSVKYRKMILNKTGLEGWLRKILKGIQDRFDIQLDRIGSDGQLRFYGL